jgi:hypothetical protein
MEDFQNLVRQLIGCRSSYKCHSGIAHQSGKERIATRDFTIRHAIAY